MFLGKAGCDRMAADCGFELKKRGVAMVSLWPGAVKTEYIQVINNKHIWHQSYSFAMVSGLGLLRLNIFRCYCHIAIFKTHVMSCLLLGRQHTLLLKLCGRNGHSMSWSKWQKTVELFVSNIQMRALPRSSIYNQP